MRETTHEEQSPLTVANVGYRSTDYWVVNAGNRRPLDALPGTGVTLPGDPTRGEALRGEPSRGAATGEGTHPGGPSRKRTSSEEMRQ